MAPFYLVSYPRNTHLEYVWNLFGELSYEGPPFSPSSPLGAFSCVLLQGGSQIVDLLLDLAKPGRGLLLQARSLTSSSRERCCSSCAISSLTSVLQPMMPR
jgi:hypothetical protein